MDSESIEKIWEEWFKEVSKEFSPELRVVVKERIKGYIYALLSGEDSEKIVEQIDDELIERIIRSGSKPEDVVRRMELFANKLSEYEEFEKVAKNFARFVPALLRKMLGVYERILQEEQERRKRAERALRVLSKVNEAVTRASDEEELLKEVCRIIVEEGGYAYAWVGYAEKDKTVKPVAASGNDDYAWVIKVTWNDSETGRGPVGSSIRLRKTVVVRETDADESFKPWREEALKRGFRSVAAIPLHVENEVIGSLAIYAPEPDAFDEEELSLLEELAESLSNAIASLREKKEKEMLEKLYELVVENTGTAILVIENGKIVFANKEVEKLSGYSREELVGKPFTILLPEEDRKEILRIHKLRLADPESAPRQYEIKYVDKEGRIRYAIITATVIPGTKRVVVSLMDITEAKEMERKLKESEERYRAVFENSPLGIVLASVDTTILDCNNAALRMFGMRREDVIGKKWTELGLFDDAKLPEIMKEFYRGLSEEFRELDLEVNIGGKLKILKVFPVLLKKEGVPYTFLNIIEDITEKMIAERKLRDALESLQILRSVDLGIIEGKNLRDMLLEVAKVVRRKIGCDVIAIRVFGENGFVVSDPEIGRSVLEKIDAEKEVVVNILEKDDLNELEVELLKGGFARYVSIPLIARDEKVGVIFAASKGIEGKDIDFLKTTAGQLAIAIHEALLFEAKMKAYEQIEKNIEQFAILVDHIRNPLAAQGYVEIFVENEEAKKKIKEQLDRVVELVEQLERGWVESEAIRDYLRREREERR